MGENLSDSSSSFECTVVEDQSRDEEKTNFRLAIEKCKKIYENASTSYETALKYRGDSEIIAEYSKLCDLYIEQISELFKSVSRQPKSRITGPLKLKYYHTLVKLISIKEDLENIKVISGGGILNQDCVKWVEISTAFNNTIRNAMIKNINHIDIKDFLGDAKNVFDRELTKLLSQNLKVYGILTAQFTTIRNGEVISELKHFSTKSYPIFPTTNLKEWFTEKISNKISADIEEFEEGDSGWTLENIKYLTLMISKYNPLKASSFIPLPTQIARKHACVNVMNNDRKGFKWAILSALAHKKGLLKDHLNRVQYYEEIEDQFDLDFSGIDFPVEPHKITKFEKQNNISVNAYVLKLEKFKYEVLPIHLTDNIKENHVDLLLIQEFYFESSDYPSESPIENLEKVSISKNHKKFILSEEEEEEEDTFINYHYVWIKNFSRLTGSQISKCKNKKFVCNRCIQHFYKFKDLERHSKLCKSINKCRIKLPSPPQENDDLENIDYKILKFKNYSYKEKVPFIVYADFESILRPPGNGERKICSHEALSIGYYFQCRFQ